MKRAGFYFTDNDDDATSFCPECGELNISISARKVLECIKINRPVYVQCAACKAWYNIGGDVEEGGRMTSTIKISEKDKVFQIATVAGWVEQTGMQVTIDEIGFAICVFNKKNKDFIQVTEIESGAKVLSIPISVIDIFVVDNRDKAIEYYKDSVIPLIQKKIKANGLDKFRKEVEKAKKYMVETHGERPEIKDFEGELK